MIRSLIVVCVALAACRSERPHRVLRADAPVLVGAGDVADCGRDGREETARILDTISGTVFVAGDASYRTKRISDALSACYDATWGRHKNRTRPVPGNHEYETGNADQYFAYFGAAASPPLGYYSYQIGTWHVVALNSAIDIGSGSKQLEWLAHDLEEHAGVCTVAYMHHPRFSSGPHTDHETMQDVWGVLADHGVAAVIAGHDHVYERFAPLDASGNVDRERGTRQFVVGTGGASRYAIRTVHPASEAHSTDDFGVLKMSLLPGRYQWDFIPVDPRGFHDHGEAACHPQNVAR